MSLDRRRLLGLGIASGIGLTLAPALPARAEPVRPAIRPRADWAQGRGPTGALRSERPQDVLFLLVHHSESPNTDSQSAIPQRIRSFYDFHTGTKGWPDVAYNFFVDRFGGIWEGRAASLTEPVRGDATGGSQGYAQLCCFIGDHTDQPPTPDAMNSMAALLAWLAATYRIDLSGGKDITFTSRGSNRFPAGTRVTTDPIAGHRDMSQTECPGAALYPLVRSQLLPAARSLAGNSAAAPSNPPAASTSTAPSSPTSPSAASSPSTQGASATPAATPSPTGQTATPAEQQTPNFDQPPQPPPRVSRSPDSGAVAAPPNAAADLAVPAIAAGGVIAATVAGTVVYYRTKPKS